MDITNELNINIDSRTELPAITKNKAKRCIAKRVDGQPCNAIGNSKTGLCFQHGALKGKPSNAKNSLDQGNVYIKTFLSRLVMMVKGGKIEPSVANSIINACKVIIEINNIEQQQQMWEEYKEKLGSGNGNRALTDLELIDQGSNGRDTA